VGAGVKRSTRITVVNGSPRRAGNTSILVERLCAGAHDGSATVDVFRLNDLAIRPCQACGVCGQSAEADCVIDDDMQPIYDAVRAADALVIASPIYWWSVSAQTKLFVDRCEALGGPEGSILRDKKIGVVLVYGGKDAVSSGAVNAIRAFQDAVRYLGSDLVDVVHGSAWEAGAVRENVRLMEEAYDLGRKLAQSGSRSR
jgi:multimeric flavodoxin WrbA